MTHHIFKSLPSLPSSYFVSLSSSLENGYLPTLSSTQLARIVEFRLYLEGIFKSIHRSFVLNVSSSSVETMVSHLPNKFPRISIVVCLFLLSLSLYFRFKMKTKKKSTKSTAVVMDLAMRRCDIHRILSSFIVPTPAGRSRFPVDFLRVPTRSSKAIELDLSLLLMGLVNGKLELRNAVEESLLSLLKGTLSLSGYQIKLTIGRMFSAKVVNWVFVNGYGGYTRPANGLVSVSDSHAAPLLDLDLLPYASIEVALQTFVRSLSPGSLGTIELSVLAPQIKFLSTTFVLCAVPFIYNTDSTATPMLLSLSRVVEILSQPICTSSSLESLSTSTASAPLQILSCTNTSAEYASSLYRHALTQDAYELLEWRKESGEARARAVSSMLQWYAAVTNAGWVQRWVVVVRR